MSHEEKINYMRVATNLCKYGFDMFQIDLLISLYDGLLEKGGEMTLRDMAKIEQDAHLRKIKRDLEKAPKQTP